MIYLSIRAHSVKLLALSKSLLGQFNVTYFHKNHESSLLEDGEVKNVDLLASALKEAVTQSKPKEVSEKDVCLVLPQESFTFMRFEIPSDITERAVASFVADKLRSAEGVSIDETYYDFLTVKRSDRREALVYALPQKKAEPYFEACKLLELHVKSIVPETTAYFKLFEKTLRDDKKERVLYTYYEKGTAWSFLFDYFGLLEDKRARLEMPIEENLKELADSYKKDEKDLNRIVLAGPESTKVRQDHFTKAVGVWTNPLEKIITNFYDEYMRMFIVSPDATLPIMEFDVCLGAFIFTHEQKQFSLLNPSDKPTSSEKKSGPKMSLSLPKIKLRDIILFVVAFVVSFAVIFFYPRLSQLKNVSSMIPSFAEPTATPTPPPPTPTPTPEVSRAKLKVRVLNGIGTKGKASEVKNILTDVGYEDVVTDNAETFDYARTEIRVSEEMKDAASTLVEDLAEYVEIEKDDITDLDTDDTADLELIIGENFE